MAKPRVAVHKFSSCDGCQLAFLNMGEELITLSELVDIVHFVEAGLVNEDADVDIAFVEGSVSTKKDEKRIQQIREKSAFLITIGACATSGGIQALRNIYDQGQWLPELYAQPMYIDSLKQSKGIAEYVSVDFELWGCPVTGKQIVAIIGGLLHGTQPKQEKQNVCMECKRQLHNCVMVTKQIPCMGAVTQAGCNALCPSLGRDCYGCFGPAEHINIEALSKRLLVLGLDKSQVRQKFHLIHSNEPRFRELGERQGNE